MNMGLPGCCMVDRHFLTFVGFWVSIYFGADSYGSVWLKHEAPMGPHNCHFDPFWVLINRLPFYLTG